MTCPTDRRCLPRRRLTLSTSPVISRSPTIKAYPISESALQDQRKPAAAVTDGVACSSPLPALHCHLRQEPSQTRIPAQVIVSLPLTIDLILGTFAGMVRGYDLNIFKYMSLAFDEYGRPFIVLKEQESKTRIKGIDAIKVQSALFSATSSLPSQLPPLSAHLSVPRDSTSWSSHPIRR